MMLSVSFYTSESPPNKNNIIFEAKKLEFYGKVFNLPFSEELLKQALIFEKVMHPEIAFYQAVLETGNFTSDIFIRGNNLFGMRYPAVRDTYASGEYNYHASYKTWLSSVKDYKLFQEWYKSKGYDLDDYYSFLESIGYAKDKEYLQKLLKTIS